VDPEAAAPAAKQQPLYADVNEPDAVIAHLRALGAPVEVRRLQPADYVIGPIAVERKTVSDFASSLFNKRLFDQVDRLRASYDQALLVLEGDLGMLDEFQGPGAFYGALCHIAVDRGVPVLPTADREQTALLLATLHKRLDREPAVYGLRHKPPGLSPSQEMMFVVQGLPNVGGVLSARLLDRFGTVRRVMRAQERELRRIPLVGPEKARRVAEVLDRPWQATQLKLEEGDEP
jgi:ERCC4-type nuclease